MIIHFEKANIGHPDIIFSWLAEPFVQEFWDNTQAHNDDILNFVNGRKEPSDYCEGKYVYWIASCDGHPFAMLMTIQETLEDPIEDIKIKNLSKTSHTYGVTAHPRPASKIKSNSYTQSGSTSLIMLV